MAWTALPIWRPYLITGLSFGDVAQGDFVAEGNVFAQFDAASRLAFEGDRAGVGAFLQVSDGDADIVVRFVQ